MGLFSHQKTKLIGNLMPLNESSFISTKNCLQTKHIHKQDVTVIEMENDQATINCKSVNAGRKIISAVNTNYVSLAPVVLSLPFCTSLQSMFCPIIAIGVWLLPKMGTKNVSKL